MRRYRLVGHTPHCRQVHDELRGPERLATFSLRSNVDTLVPDNLNRYNRKQIPCLSLCKRLGSTSSSWARDVVASLQCQYYSTGPFKQVWQRTVTNPLTLLDSKGSMAQLVSAMVMFCSNLLDTYKLKSLVLGGRGWPRAWGAMRLTTLNASPWQNMSFAHGPIVLTNQMS